MRVQVSIGHYVAGQSPLHSMDPRAKLLGCVVLMVSMFLVHTAPQVVLATAAVLCLCALGSIGPWRLLRSQLPVVLGLLVICALNLLVTRTGPVLVWLGPVPITSGGLTTAALFAVRLVLLVMVGALLLMTTTPTALTDGAQRLLSPLGRLGVPVAELALVLSLALRFVPTLGDEVQSVLDAQASRGAALKGRGVLGSVRSLGSVLVPVFAGSLRHARNLSRALDARGWQAGAPRTVWHAPSMGRGDVLSLVAVAAYVVLLVCLGR